MYEGPKVFRLPWTDFAKSRRDDIVKKVLDHVKDNDTCRVGWACEQVLGWPCQPNVHDKIAARCIKTFRYKKEPANPDIFEVRDWNIIVNPEYRVFKSVLSTNKAVKRQGWWSIRLAGLSILFIVASVWIEYRDKTEEKIEGLQKEVQILNSKLERIVLLDSAQNLSKGQDIGCANLQKTFVEPSPLGASSVSEAGKSNSQNTSK